MTVILDLKFLVLLAVANGMPIFAKNILQKRWSEPVDGGARFSDGRPILGASKTVRGLVLSLSGTMLMAALIGMGWKIGAVVAAMAMLGDMFSSFLKRRLGLVSSAQALGLDQLPESLFPALASIPLLKFTLLDVVVIVASFFFGELLLSRLLYRLRLRDRPY